MRVASFIGFWVMIGVAINAFWRDEWWQTLLQVLTAPVIGWFSAGFFERAGVSAVRRTMRGGMTEDDLGCCETLVLVLLAVRPSAALMRTR
jgi:hypothetical protein